MNYVTRPLWCLTHETTGMPVNGASDTTILAAFYLSNAILINSSHLDKMAAFLADDNFKCIFLNGFEFHWNLFPWFKLVVGQQWFRQWLGAKQAYYLNHCLPSSLTHICGTRGRWVKWIVFSLPETDQCFTESDVNAVLNTYVPCAYDWAVIVHGLWMCDKRDTLT